VQVGDDQQRQDHGEDRGHQPVELLGEHLLAEGTDRQAGERDAKLHRGDEPRRVARDLEDEAGALVALVLELHDPRPPRRHEAVLRRDEERVREQQPEQGKNLEEEGHAWLHPEGACVLGGRSSSTRISGASIAAAWTTRTYVL